MKSKRKNTKKDILFILISSFVVTSAWVGFNLYHIWITSTVSENIQMQLIPIDPTFDPATLEQLTTRESIKPLYTLQPIETQTTPQPTPSVTASSQVTLPVTTPTQASNGSFNVKGQ